MKKIITMVLVISLGLLSACNTVQGLGKDISNGGRDIQRAAS